MDRRFDMKDPLARESVTKPYVKSGTVKCSVLDDAWFGS